MSKSRTRDGEFVAYVYENDHKEIRKFVHQYPDIETGGDLFGLWKDERTVIIQQFIGPGKDCKRTSTSFHQDIQYLHKVGSLITTEEGLCNVGEWHSHHQIGMPAPSGADRRTVFSNMPHLGLERFVLFIASIEGTGSSGKKRSYDVKLDDIKLRPFLFLDSAQDIVEGEIEIIPGSNPHRRSSRIGKEIEDGAEETLDGAKRTSKKKAGKEGGKPAQNEARKRDEPRTLQQQADEQTSARQAQGEQPRPPSRETKPQNAGVTEPYMDDESLGRKSRDDQQRAGREQDQYTERKREGKGNETQRRDGLNNENRSPNTGPTAPGGLGYQSQPTSPPTPQMNTPQHFGTTQPWGPGTQGNMPPTTSFMQVLDNSRHSGAVQGQGPGAYSSHQSQQPPDYTQQMRSQRSTRGRGHSQGNVSHQSHAAERSSQAQAKDCSGIPVGKITGKGLF